MRPTPPAPRHPSARPVASIVVATFIASGCGELRKDAFYGECTNEWDSCPSGYYCRAGQCMPHCPGGCPSGYECINNQCVHSTFSYPDFAAPDSGPEAGGPDAGDAPDGSDATAQADAETEPCVWDDPNTPEVNEDTCEPPATCIGGQCIGDSGTPQACGPDDPTACWPGADVCVCNGDAPCPMQCCGSGCAFAANGDGERDWRCDQGDCAAVSNGTATVSFECAGGGCQLVSNGDGDRTLTCTGNGCTMRCTGGGSCSLQGCTANCKLTCSGTVQCVQACTDPTCTVARDC